MQNEKLLLPDYLFEVGWEVCNKVGGIHTVIATKIASLRKVLNKPHILIGPDVIQGNETNQEFIEDSLLLKAWRAKAASEGLRIRVGRWNVADEPIIVLIDFTPFFSQKDEILSLLWEKYHLDSLTGQWDYIEPTLFGYAAGKVIESYIKYHCAPNDKIIAQFHEWMTGSGLLYLKSAVPQVGCVFTTHATVLGRCIAGNGLPLYDNLKSYHPDVVSRTFNVVAKQSLEKLAALEADSFTTVSDITAKECEQFFEKPVDIVTPNGFQDFIADESDFLGKEKKGRDELIKVAEAILARPIDNNALLIGISGRYEFKNKGIDVFIEALGKLNQNKALTREVVGFILVPAGHHGPIKDLLYNLNNKADAKPLRSPYLSHELSDEQYDPVINAIRNNGLNNSNEDKVKIFFVPSYLNGNDGIFDMPYYDLLAGLNLALFPSYYEPWGYTPLESVAFKVPTITTTLAGFGLWVRTHYTEERPGITVIKRTDDNDAEVIAKIEEHVIRHADYKDEEYRQVKENAYEVSKIALWDNLIYYYMKAYSDALTKVAERYTESDFISDNQTNYIPQMPQSVTPNWLNIMVHRNVPTRLKALEVLAYNMWWCWNQDAKELFQSIDPVAWEKVYFNPIALLDSLNFQRYQALENDHDFVNKLDAVYARFNAYMAEKNKQEGPTITYFCMEYGLHSSLKIYSGGLGILAGDYLKEASDKGVKMTGIGLLYRYGYFTQRLSTTGEQENIYEAQRFDKIPIVPQRDEEGNWITVQIALPGRNLHARVWRVDVGRVELFLLDTDFEDNLPEDRSVTHHLYGGDWENRLKQELLLGIGGIRVLGKLNRRSNVYHCNEGHAAFTGMERIHQLMVDKNLSFEEAKEVVRSSSLFTTHTPVPAGHDAFEEGLLRKYISHYPDRFQVSWETIMGMGRIHPSDSHEKFSMSNLAVNLSQEVNGVSWLHGKVSQEMFKDMFPGYLTEESYISYVTNGVHYPTWAAPEWKELHERVFGADFANHHYDKSCFANIHGVDNHEIWGIRSKLRARMIEHIKERLTKHDELMYYTPREIVSIVEALDPTKLTFGFARRFATYKRAQLLFKDINTLNEIVNHPTRPVQFIFAGKAHPADKAGQDLIKKIVEISKYPQFLGKILFIENYDMELASSLVQGVDIWLNTPTRPMEASGTSGEKAVMNGVMHFSVLDGWWVEGYQKDAGWALPLEQVYKNDEFQNELDAELVYSTIENEIAPLFYDKDAEGVPNEWIQHIKNSIDKVASNFTMNRQLTDYEDRFYNKLNERAHQVRKDNFAMAKDIVAWKHKMARGWDSIEVMSVNMPSIYKEDITLGQTYELEIKLSCGSLSAEDIGVELVVTNDKDTKTDDVLVKEPFTLVDQSGSIATYRLKYTTSRIGSFSIGLRVYAQNDMLAHQQDSGLVKWM
ncbi:alpha-glucan family phosphorylase [Dysgonomonas macrotermitis]|uniref:Phosphorylase / glycogen(Starch) synthase n=1 Tax=Dysgonomonas macrotermitis TaxID=1346286 RepID=A0A1M5B1B8_9BACT|nr:alpha-glucan family phosphorylase [Dysgonomonas macrotermitis]SHF36265.1 phosphorylase / glycogen(starch) synthase [Dysgonomonas macrotermitis]